LNLTPSEFQALASRVAKLETQNRRWRFAFALLAVCGFSLVLMGAKAADRMESQLIRAHAIEAQEFILKDEDGHIYARLSMNSGKQQTIGGVTFVMKEGGPALQFYDEKGGVVWKAPTKAELIPAK
jgi:hypothetical protein